MLESNHLAKILNLISYNKIYHGPSKHIKVRLRFLESSLKGLGHTILGNFSTDRMVIELTKISK